MYRKKKLIYIIDVLGVGGAEKMLNAIIMELAQDFEIRVCVFREKDGNPIAREIQAQGVPVDFLPIPRLKDITALPRLVGYLRRFRPDIIHTQLEFADVLGSIAARILNIPAVTTVHIIPPVLKSGKRYFHGKLWLQALRTFSTQVISVSEEVRNFYINRCGIPPQKITTIYNGIDLTPFSRDRLDELERLRQKLKIPTESLVFLTVAILRPPKGIQNMIQALPTILVTHPNVVYLIVGDGPAMPALQEVTQEHGLGNKVIFTGMQTDIPLYLSIGDIFVLPTLTEALPTVIVEAMAARLPIVASAVGGIPEMVTPGTNGILVTPGDIKQLENSCLDLLESKARRERMGDNGWEIAQNKFNLKIQANKLKSFYLEQIF